MSRARVHPTTFATVLLQVINASLMATAMPLSSVPPTPTISADTPITSGARWKVEDGWNRCLVGSRGQCSLFIATGDGAPTAGIYRNVALFNSDCEPLDLVMTAVENEKVVLRGSLEYYVDVHMNREASPDGMVNYKDRAWRLDEGGLGNTMECHKFEGMDGLACRMAFDCS